MVKKGYVKRQVRRVVGLFIDGTGLDRATRRINRKVDMTALVRGVTAGVSPVVARYYTLIPFEDDSRHRAFLDAVARAGLTVVVKRLPPKGVNRQVSVDLEMAADMVAFALGHQTFSSLHAYDPSASTAPLSSSAHETTRGSAIPGGLSLRRTVPRSDHRAAVAPLAVPAGVPLNGDASAIEGNGGGLAPSSGDTPGEGLIVGPDRGVQGGATATSGGDNESPSPLASQVVSPIATSRIVTVVCPSRDLSYPIGLVRELGVDTVTADFGQFNTGDVLKSAAKWIDLSDSETIWRE